MNSTWITTVLILCLRPAIATLEQGKWEFILTQDVPERSVVKSLFKGSNIYLDLSCIGNQDKSLKWMWRVQNSTCLQDYQPYAQPEDYDAFEGVDNSSVTHENAELYNCSEPFRFSRRFSSDSFAEPSTALKKLVNESNSQSLRVPHNLARLPLLRADEEGFYKFTIRLEEVHKAKFEASVRIEMRSADGGYLSAANWPLLPFYGIMCLVYLALGLIWLIVSFLQWRDLLRIQFWIGGVIFLGMLEMATFYAEYSSFNATGESMLGAVLLAEIVSCGKRTLARMLVIIVSLGFGIVKPRLGPMLHRVVGVGVLYFVLAVIESYLRVTRLKSDSNSQFVLATVPLAVLDSAICWWIFISLSQTTRTLRLRRNLTKLNLYRHFTNILIFAVVASVLFMLYSIKAHRVTVCSSDWKALWVDDAYWRVLFSIILLVIMILWRPTNNNQRYAFSPLLDAPEDDDDDDEEQFVNDAYGVKMRGQGSGASSPKLKNNVNTPDDDLKWVEENIPASLADNALPILDSDEEIMTTRFELSKMQ